MLWEMPFPYLVTRSEVFSVKGKEIHRTKKGTIGENWVFPYTGRWKTDILFTAGISEIC